MKNTSQSNIAPAANHVGHLQEEKVSPPELKPMAGQGDRDLQVLACQTLVSAYKRGRCGAGIDWSDLDLAAGLAAAGIGESLEDPDSETAEEDELSFLDAE